MSLTIQEAFSQVFQEKMKNANMSASDLSEKSGLEESIIQELMAGNIHLTIDIIFRASDTLGLKEGELMREVRYLCPEYGLENLPESHRKRYLEALEKEREEKFAEELRALLRLIDPNYKLNPNDVSYFKDILRSLTEVNKGSFEEK